MGLTVNIETNYGVSQAAYVRLNNMEVSNNGCKAVALFRGYLSKDAYEEGKGYLWEQTIEFDADVTLPLWPQAYAALESFPEFSTAKAC